MLLKDCIAFTLPLVKRDLLFQTSSEFSLKEMLWNTQSLLPLLLQMLLLC